MSERELTEPVDLCLPSGRRLNPEAVGWSRQPLHRANLAGVWGRTKKWDYWAIQSETMVVAVTLANLDYLGTAGVEWFELTSRTSGGRVVTVPLGRGLDLPDTIAAGSVDFGSRHLRVHVDYGPETTGLQAVWDEPDGTPGSASFTVGNSGESLNVVIPWSQRRFQFTSKHQARPATGQVTIGDRVVRIGSDEPAWGILDVGRGRWPYRTRWNWGGGAGYSPDGRLVGLQFGGRWTQGTGYTENGVFTDGRLSKIGEELDWRYRWDDPMQPWRVRSSDGRLDVTLTPVYDRHAHTNLAIAMNEVHQVFGHWSGTVPDGAGSTLRIHDALGFAEESRARW